MFYLSTRGSSASWWLANSLSKHPNLVCFGATRTFPPIEPNGFTPGGSKEIPELSPDDFIEGLLECERATSKQKIFGSIHGYHGIKAKEACESSGGIFSYVTRHPVSRVHSAFIYYLDLYYKANNIKVSNRESHDHICSIFQEDAAAKNLARLIDIRKTRIKQSPLKSMAKKVLPNSIVKGIASINNSTDTAKRFLAKPSFALNETTFACNLIIDLTHSIFEFDEELHKECPLDSGIKMEEMVKSGEYFKRHVLKRVAPDLNTTNSYIASIFSESRTYRTYTLSHQAIKADGKRFNTHRDVPISHQEIWETWPIALKRNFLYFFERYNISEICRHWDYDISYI